ncbi:MAG: hypothetical protein ACOX8H_01570 [Ruminococcus sp.]|jgi:hypothetical protein
MTKQLYDAHDVMDLLRVSESKAYKIIKQLNGELERDNFLTIRGKVPIAYLQKRFFGLADDETNDGKGD